MNTAGAGGSANDARVDTSEHAKQQKYLDALADDAERAVEVIEAHIDGAKQSLADAKTEAKRARAAAQTHQKEQ